MTLDSSIFVARDALTLANKVLDVAYRTELAWMRAAARPCLPEEAAESVADGVWRGNNGWSAISLKG